MMNQRTIRTGRARDFSAIGRPAILLSVTMFMSRTFSAIAGCPAPCDPSRSR